jgi:hypothetical protein
MVQDDECALVDRRELGTMTGTGNALKAKKPSVVNVGWVVNYRQTYGFLSDDPLPPESALHRAIESPVHEH